MEVRKPLNANDADINDEVDAIGLPREQPTCMSYFLERIRLAEVCRTFTDRLPLPSNPEEVGYEHVLQADAALEQFIRDIPGFFTMESSELEKLPRTDPRWAPSVLVQRHILNLFVHGQRLRIHLPYLARATVEPEYAFSRDVCLKSARFILHVERRLEHENTAFAATRPKITVILHSVFIASIALLLDICSTTDAAERAAKQPDMNEAWRIMEQAQSQSVPAARLMELLKQVMKKHKVSFSVTQPQERPVNGLDGQGSIMPLTPTSGASREVPNDLLSFDPAYVEQQWDFTDQRMDLDAVNWDSLFWGMDAPFI